MNDMFMRFWEMGISEDIYDLIGLISIVVAYIFCFICGKKYKMKGLYVFLIITVVLLVSFTSIHIIILEAVSFIRKNSTIKALYMTSIIRVLLLIPMVGFWICKVLKVQWCKVCDMLAYLPLIIGCIGAFGCLFTGCCQGYQCSWGVYNPYYKSRVFPIQIVNAIIMFAIGLFLYCRARRKNFESDGLSYPIMLVLFGVTRFITEYFADNYKIWGGLSVLAIHCLKDVLVGVVVITVICHKQGISTKKLLGRALYEPKNNKI